MSRLVRPWIGWEKSLGGFPRARYVSLCLVLQIVGAIAPFMMVFLAAWHGAGLACVPPWHVKSTAEAHVPIVVVLVLVRRSCW